MLDQIIELAQKQQELGGIDITKLRPGTKIEVKTQDGKYFIELIDRQGNIIIKGPEITNQTNAYFAGSTWGGSIMKLHWIGLGMNMELSINNKPFLTRSVKAAKITGPNWEYEFDWNSKDEA